jgi:hypothetical protein
MPVRRNTRRVKRGGRTRQMVETERRLNEAEHTTQIALHEAEQTGIRDAKRPDFRQFQGPTLARLQEIMPVLVRKFPRVSEEQLQNAYKRGWHETRQVRGGRRKTLRGGTSKQMVEALREAENMGRIHKTVGDPSRADSVADSLMRRFHLVDVEPGFHPRTLLRDKYIATYNQTSRATTQGSFFEALQGRIANLLS